MVPLLEYYAVGSFRRRESLDYSSVLLAGKKGLKGSQLKPGASALSNPFSMSVVVIVVPYRDHPGSD